MTAALAKIRLHTRWRPDYDLTVSDFMRFFSGLRLHVTIPICAPREEIMGIGSLDPCSVNPALHSPDLEN